MNVAQSRILLRERTVAEILDLACMVSATAALWPFAKLAALVLLPCTVGCLLLRHVWGWSWPAVWVVAWALASVAQGVFTVAAGRWLFADEVGVAEVLGAFARRSLAYVGTWIASLVYLAGGAALLISLPYVWAHTLVVPEACLLERATPVSAIQRSARFVRGEIGRAVALLLALVVARLGAIGLGEIVGDGLVDGVLQLGSPTESLWSDGGSPYALAGFMLSVPLVAMARFLAYVDGRTRGDGWDIQVRFMAMAAEAEQLGRRAG